MFDYSSIFYPNFFWCNRINTSHYYFNNMYLSYIHNFSHLHNTITTLFTANCINHLTSLTPAVLALSTTLKHSAPYLISQTSLNLHHNPTEQHNLQFHLVFHDSTGKTSSVCLCNYSGNEY